MDKGRNPGGRYARLDEDYRDLQAGSLHDVDGSFISKQVSQEGIIAV